MRMSPTYFHALLASMALGAICVIGCASSESSPGKGSGGVTGSGSGGSTGSGGMSTGSGGTTVMGSGGMVAASGGTVGSDASDTAGPVDVKAEVAAEVQAETGPAGPATFTELYMTIFGPSVPQTSACGGTDCHDPGIKDAVNMKTQMTAYTSLRAKVTPNNVAGSALIRRLETTVVPMRMPLNKPALMPSQIARVRSWIMAGAKND